MRIFINNADTYVGKALCADLNKVLEEPNRLFGTVSPEAASLDSRAFGKLVSTLGLRRVVSRDDAHKYFKDVLSCSLVVFDLHTGDVRDAEAIIKELKIAELDHDITFVLISSVNCWARTKVSRVPVPKGDDEDEEEEEEVPDDEADPDAPPKEPKVIKTMPDTLTDAQLDRRTPSLAHEPWKYIETLTFSLCSKPRVRTHVVGAGILYGNGETTFNELFKAAWLSQPVHVILAPGDNYIPCVHVRDVARLVRIVAADTTLGRYLIAVDKARLTQAEIVQGIVDNVSRKREIPVISPDQSKDPFKDILTLDLIMEASAPMKSKEFPWWSKKGIVANISRVAAEFCTWRTLRPIKMIMIGPPGAGSEHYCSMVGKQFLHADPPVFTFDSILQDTLKEETAFAKGLNEKLKAGAKLKMKHKIRILKKRLKSNVCKYRGYVLEGFPGSYEEAEALFMDDVPGPDDDPPKEPDDNEEEEEEEDEEEQGEKGEDDEEEEEDDGKPKKALNKDIAPELVVVLNSAVEMCKVRIFDGKARGASSEEEFLQKTAEYRKANLAEDGSPGTSDFFEDVAGTKVLHVNVDQQSDVEAFQTIRVYMESRGSFFNYLRSEEERNRERIVEVARSEEAADRAKEQAMSDRVTREDAERQRRVEEEAGRLRMIADGEASLLETEAMPLRQYLMMNVVPTLTEGLIEVCKVTPDDPIEYLAEFLFAHAQDIAPQLAAQSSRD